MTNLQNCPQCHTPMHSASSEDDGLVSIDRYRCPICHHSVEVIQTSLSADELRTWWAVYATAYLEDVPDDEVLPEEETPVIIPPELQHQLDSLWDQIEQEGEDA